MVTSCESEHTYVSTSDTDNVTCNRHCFLLLLQLTSSGPYGPSLRSRGLFIIRSKHCEMSVGKCRRRRDLRNETEKSWGVTSQPITPIRKRLSLASRGRIGSAVPSQSSSVPQFPVSPNWTWPWKPVCPYHRRRPVSYKKTRGPLDSFASQTIFVTWLFSAKGH